jgi:hypothetical protein
MSAAPKHPFESEPPSAPQLKAAESLAKLVAPAVERVSKKREFQVSKGHIDKARSGMQEMLGAEKWKDATGTHLVALYEWVHEKIYGVLPLELDGRAWARAASMANRMVATHFENDFEKAVTFMRWVWRGEKKREEWRRDKGVDGGRIGWWQMFNGGRFITDYKVSVDRATKR